MTSFARGPLLATALLLFVVAGARAASVSLMPAAPGIGLRAKDGVDAAKALARGWSPDVALVHVESEDQVFEDHGVKVIVDPKSLPYIDGTELDFVREGLNEGFKFSNPREKDRCGCGESFRV